MHALRGQGELRGIEATRPLCGIQRDGNRKSQGARARLCEFPGFGAAPQRSPKLFLVQRQRRGAFPELAFGDDRRQDSICAVDGTAEAVEEPQDPSRDVRAALLGALKLVVVGVPLDPDLRGHAVEPLRAGRDARSF